MTLRNNFLLILLLLMLSGCMYPQEQLSQNELTNDAQLHMVQQAINQYQERNEGRLPIITKDQDTPIYQKYLIDFTLLKQQGLIQSIPGSAFENGGFYQYVLIDVETEPTVKVIDLRVTDQLREVQQKLNFYRNEHTYPPFGEKEGEGVYTLNYEALNLDKPPHIESPYSGNNLPILMNTDGELIIDYRLDLYPLLEETDRTFQQDEDIRSLLTDQYPIVPAYSAPYYVKNNKPVFAIQ